MATRRLTMRKTRDILRMKWNLGLSHRKVAQSLSVSAGAVGSVMNRARAAKLDWDEVCQLDEASFVGHHSSTAAHSYSEAPSFSQ